MAHEIHEHIEHAGHADQGGGLSRLIGITIAVLGVIMALCSAQLGAVRTELVATMVEEAGAKSKYAAVATKYRMLQAQLQHLHASMPDLAVMDKKNEELKKLESEVTSPETKQSIKASHLHAGKILNTVIPTPEDVERFLDLLDRTREENEAAKEWAESYHDAVAAQKIAAEFFEYAMLCAEIGIVIASVGLLLSKQKRFAQGAWGIALLLGLLSMSTAAGTFVFKTQKVLSAEQKIEKGERHYEHANRDENDVKDDQKLEEDMRKEMPALKKFIADS